MTEPIEEMIATVAAAFDDFPGFERARLRFACYDMEDDRHYFTGEIVKAATDFIVAIEVPRGAAMVYFCYEGIIPDGMSAGAVVDQVQSRWRLRESLTIIIRPGGEDRWHVSFAAFVGKPPELAGGRIADLWD